MIEKANEIYIKEMSILEKHRGLIAISLLIVEVLIIIALILDWPIIISISEVALGLGVVACVIIRICDFFKIVTKLPKCMWLHYFKEYEKYKFSKIKVALQEMLKGEKCYNLQTIQTLLDETAMRFENKKDDNVEGLKWIASTIISIVALKEEQLAIALLVGLFICVMLISKKILDIAFDYVLINEVDYNMLYDILTEIKLDIINNKKETNIMENNGFCYLVKTPTEEEFNNLTDSVGWG